VYQSHGWDRGVSWGGMGNPSSDTPEHLHDLTAIKHFPCPTPMVNRCRWLQVSCEHALVVPTIPGIQLPCSEGTRAATNVLCTLRMQYKLHTANPELSASSDVCTKCKRSDNGVAPHTRKLQPTPLPINGKTYSFFLPTSGFQSNFQIAPWAIPSYFFHIQLVQEHGWSQDGPHKRSTWGGGVHITLRIPTTVSGGASTRAAHTYSATATCGYMNTSITWCTSARHMGHRVISGRRAHSAHMQRCPHGTNAASFSRSVHTTHKRWSFLDISSRCAFLAFARRASI